jgi:diguanylate cyclase (GGDEF)-like protein
MTLDARSVTLLMVVIGALTGGALLAVTRGYLREVRGAATWGWATVVQAVGWLIFGVLRGVMPEAASIIAGQLLIQLSLVLYLRAIEEFFDRAFNPAWWYALMAVEGIGLFVTAVVVPDFGLRQVVMSASKAVVAFWCARALLRSASLRASQTLTAALFFVSGVLMLLRLLVFVFWAQIANEQPLENHWFTQLTYLSYFVIGLSLTLAFILMCNERYLDIRRVAEDRLRLASLTDPLTQLPNRVMIADRIKQLVGKVEREPGDLYAVLFVDLDDFKRVNDTLGHDAGDALLVETARRLDEITRQHDAVERNESSLAGRFGGDEFVVVLDELREAGHATRIADRILAAMHAPFHVGGRDIEVRCSIGVSTSAGGHGSMDELIRDADVAMYRAKAAGKGGYVMFDDSMRGGARAS